MLPPSVAGDAERLARFRREAQVLASLNHPHIGSIYGVHEADGQRFLILELAEGETLAARIARRRCPSTRLSRSPARSPRRSKPRTDAASSIAT